MWLNHHRVFQQVRSVDGVLLVLNLNLLLWVALVPFATGIVADYLRDLEIIRPAGYKPKDEKKFEDKQLAAAVKYLKAKG